MLPVLENFLFSPVKSQIILSVSASDALKRLGVISCRDILFYFPISYQTRIIEPNLAEVKEGELIQTKIIIENIALPVRKSQPVRITASNNTGSLLLVFFHKLPPFIFNKLKPGSSHIISGKVQFFDHHLQISHPEFIGDPKFTSAIEPIYSLTYGLNNKQLYAYIIKIIEIFEEKYKRLQDEILKNYLKSLLEEIKTLHLYRVNIAVNQIEQAKQESLKRLASMELLANQMSLYNIRQQIRLKQGNNIPKAANTQQLILDDLGFDLTAYQRQVIDEIELDQNSDTEMMRLLQGDVGSGKTLVALLTMVNAVCAGFQTTLMAPTDLLANQHYEFFVKALKVSNIRVALLTGKVQGIVRKNIILQLENGEIDMLIGTHALFQEKVVFNKLGYIVIDEQHRFGVQQRLNLISKGVNPDVLVMTATPIPRSLALTMFGDMTISKLTGKPKNRLPITTNTMSTNKIEHIIEVLDKKLKADERIYWICPLIDQGEKEELQADNLLMDIMNRYSSIDGIYKGLVGILHGKMKNEQKDSVMKQFKDGEIKILVATTVIEVGIDIPAASLIIIENAEQFGLAQLHQLRGRVGRGSLMSYCILLYNPQRLSKVARTRFEIMKQTNDGFYIAEQDLKLRGSGEILGVKQSGEVSFFFADIGRDYELLIKANKFAETAQEVDAGTNAEFINFQIKLFAKAELNELN